MPLMLLAAPEAPVSSNKERLRISLYAFRQAPTVCTTISSAERQEKDNSWCSQEPLPIETFQPPTAVGRVPGATMSLRAQPVPSRQSLNLVLLTHHLPVCAKYSHVSPSCEPCFWNSGGFPTSPVEESLYVPLMTDALSPWAPRISIKDLDCTCANASCQHFARSSSISARDFASIFTSNALSGPLFCGRTQPSASCGSTPACAGRL
mmetsp:Transcript_32/g.112  ORF Transcript_32/g.112 Transcript_32/m.112 type:complete len:207 (-) Transcript_32:1076-1696(-)